MNGVRSCHAPVAQNLPTLSVLNESTASGEVPLLIAARSFVSLTFFTVFDGDPGYASVERRDDLVEVLDLAPSTSRRSTSRS